MPSCKRIQTVRLTSISDLRRRRVKEANWVPTDPQRGFEVMFRAYGPTKAFMEKQWRLPDLEVVN